VISTLSNINSTRWFNYFCIEAVDCRV